MRPLHWLLLAIAGVALLYYVRRRQLVAAGSNGNAPSGPNGTINAPTSSQGPTRYGNTGTTSSGSARDVAPADLEATGERDVFLDDWYWNRGPTNPVDDAIWASDWRERFNRQVLRPAQALTAADLSPEDFAFAQRLLDGSLTPPPPEEATDLQKRQKSLNDSDALADELYGIWKLVAQIAGAFTFGLTTVAATLTDQLGGADGKTITQELDARNAVDALVQGSLSGGDVATLVKWIGPVALIGVRRPSDWTPEQLGTVVNYLQGKSSTGDTGAPPAIAIDHVATPAGVMPVYSRSQLFASSRGGPYLRWNAAEIVTGRTFPERVNLRARILRAIDVISCQLFPYTEPEITPAGSSPGEPPGLYCWFNPLYRGGDGKSSGWIKGSIFRPGRGDLTYDGILAVQRAITSVGVVVTAPPPIAASLGAGAPLPTSGTIGTPLPLGGLGALLGTVGDPTGSTAAHRAM